MRLLVLGGTHHVGRAVVETALARGDEVTTLTRGVSGPPAAGARALHADRTTPGGLAAALGDADWDAVIDTWSGGPRAVRDAARILGGRAGHYCYVSSRSVYQWPLPPGADESTPGDVLAPGPPGRPLQYIDCRDLAAWLLHAADTGLCGTFNTVSKPGQATMSRLLEAATAVTGSAARLVWAPPEVIEKTGIKPWTELPIWVPPDGELAGLHNADVSAAYAAGLRCRPIEETVADTWAWLLAEGDPPPQPGRPAHGVDPERERQALAMAAS
jgi:2'-hydroxyisoflavone reductase